jgi:hypothetical protein
MRKIVSKEKEERKTKRNQLLVGGFLIVIITISTLGYSFMGGEKERTEKMNYNGFKFVKQGNFWITSAQGLQFSFLYPPNETQSLKPATNLTLGDYYSKPLYLSSDNNEAEYEIYRNLQGIVLRTQEACLKETGCKEGLPIKSCQDNFILVQEAEYISVEQQENCVLIKAPKAELAKATDRFLFSIIGIQ